MRCKTCGQIRQETVFGVGPAHLWCQCPRPEWHVNTAYQTYTPQCICPPPDPNNRYQVLGLVCPAHSFTS